MANDVCECKCEKKKAKKFGKAEKESEDNYD